MNREGVLEQWVIYDHPRDYPLGFIARRWEITPNVLQATGESVKGATLDQVRDQLPRGLCRLPRFAKDDPFIVEVWT